MININEDQIHSGESPKEYRARLLRTIQSGDITSMDRHDRVHGALAFAQDIQSQYPGHAVNVVVRHFLKKGGESNATGLIVTGIDSKGKNLTGQATGAGGTSTRHRQEVNAEVRNITGLHVSRYSFLNPQHLSVLTRLMDFKGLREMYEQTLNEEKKPYKGFVKGKNHPEGGLSRKEAHRQGIHAGIETKDEAKRKGGFGKLSKKTQSRRKSFCARMCGMKKRNTSSKTANDPKSKINAALRVWGCRCGTNESYETETTMLNERRSVREEFITMILEKKKMGDPCWTGYHADGMKKKNGKSVPNCVPVKESSMNEIQLRVKEKFMVEGCGCGGKDKPKPKPKPTIKTPKNQITEEVVNKSNQPMTKKEIKKRDKIKKGLGDVAIVKKGDTKENAKYRLATYITLLKKKKKKG